MHRFYLPPEHVQAETLSLEGKEAHHAVQVLRLQTKERVVVLDGAGHEFLCEAREIGKRTVHLNVIQTNRLAPLPYQITLVQAITKSKAMDLIIQKATELGVHRIVPILSERTVSSPDAENGKLEKWTNTAIEAIKQCGSAWLPRIETPVPARTFLARQEAFDLPMIATLRSQARHPREHFQNFLKEHSRAPVSIAIWIGPEGDYTPAEINAVLGSGALPITLGQLILRSETAAIYGLSVLNYELQAPVLTAAL